VPFAFALYNFWNLILIASIYADLTYFCAVRQNNVSGMMEKAVIELACNRIIFCLDSPLRLICKGRNTKQHIKKEWRHFAIPRQFKFSAPLPDGKEIAEGCINTAAEH